MKNHLPPLMRPLLRGLLLPTVVVCLQTPPVQAHRRATQTVLERTVTVQLESQTIKAALSRIAKQANIRFVYNQQLVGAERKVSVHAKNEPLATVLDELFAPLKVEYEINNDRVILRLPTKPGDANNSGSASLSPEAVPVAGKVVDAKGNGLPGVTVLVKGTTNGTSTGPDGSFSIQAPENSVLVFSFVGYTRQEQPVTGATNSLTVTLAESAQDLNDVVVIGYGTARKSDLTGAVASVTSAQLTQVATSDPVQALQGRVAGVEVTSNSGQPGSGTRIRVRGVGTINNSDPLYVVDGIQTSDIGFLLPADI